MPLYPNQILRQRYRIQSLLGQGGFGAVYRAFDLNLARVCAVKENLDAAATAQQQFQSEAYLLSRLRHPSLPQIYDYFIEPNGSQYLVMEFVEGVDLANLVRQHGKLNQADALLWSAQILDALAYTHSRQPPVIHRDIKPQNIIITPRQRAMLVDFGIAKNLVAGQATMTGARAVSPGFSPPEQYGRGTTDARSDLYALGATLYFALTGADLPESVDRLSGATLATPRAHNAAIAPHVEQAILHALELNATNRPARASDLKDELLRATAVPSPAVQPMRDSLIYLRAPVIAGNILGGLNAAAIALPSIGAIFGMCFCLIAPGIAFSAGAWAAWRHRRAGATRLRARDGLRDGVYAGALSYALVAALALAQMIHALLNTLTSGLPASPGELLGIVSLSIGVVTYWLIWIAGGALGGVVGYGMAEAI